MQTNCDRCGSDLVEGAAYCAKCGERTRRARSNIRLAVRIEVLAVLLTLGLIVAFSVILLNQPAAPIH